MTYLSVANFWKFQNADAWKKSKVHPPWCKLWVHRDRELDALPPLARLLWFELLAAATRYSNVLEADLNWIWAETRVPPEAIAEMLPLLLKGGWLSETDTPRRSRKPSRKTLEEPLEAIRLDVDVDVDVEQDKDKSKSSLALVPAAVYVEQVKAASGQTLTTHFIDASRLLGSDPPARVKGQVAKLVGELLKEGVDPGRVRAGIDLMLQKRTHPSTLPSMVHEAALPPRPRANGRVTPTDIWRDAQRQEREEALND